jgi:hypothetical protein
MKTYLRLLLRKIVSALFERSDLMLENMVLRHQIYVVIRLEVWPQFGNAGRLAWIFLSLIWPRWSLALEFAYAEIVKRRRRQGFRHYLLGKSRRCWPGLPAIEPKIQKCIQHMSRQNVLWGAPRIHGELLKLGMNVCQARSQIIWSTALAHRDCAGVPFFIIMSVKLSTAQYFQDSSEDFDGLSPGFQALLIAG